MKKWMKCILAVMIMFVIAGCSQKGDVKQTTLYVEDDGEVTSVIVEPLDKDYYDEKELTDWVNNAVNEYNAKKKDALKLQDCEVEKGTSKVTIEYASMEDYSAFNNVRAFEGNISEAEQAGYALEGEFVSTKDKPSITYRELAGSTQYHVIILEEELSVSLDHDILYASPNVKAEGKKASVSPQAEELAYIIYKP